MFCNWLRSAAGSVSARDQTLEVRGILLERWSSLTRTHCPSSSDTRRAQLCRTTWRGPRDGAWTRPGPQSHIRSCAHACGHQGLARNIIIHYIVTIRNEELLHVLGHKTVLEEPDELAQHALARRILLGRLVALPQRRDGGVERADAIDTADIIQVDAEARELGQSVWLATRCTLHLPLSRERRPRRRAQPAHAS